MPPEIDLDALAKAASTGGRTRAPLVIWMCEHHDEFAAMLERQGVNWTRITEFFADAGFAGADGQPLIPRTVRSCWARARKIIASRQAKARAQQTPAPPRQAAIFKPATMRQAGQGVSAEERRAAGDPANQTGPAAPAKPKFEFVKMRNDGRGVSDAERRALGDPTAPADPDNPKWRGENSAQEQSDD